MINLHVGTAGQELQVKRTLGRTLLLTSTVAEGQVLQVQWDKNQITFDQPLFILFVDDPYWILSKIAKVSTMKFLFCATKRTDVQCTELNSKVKYYN